MKIDVNFDLQSVLEGHVGLGEALLYLHVKLVPGFSGVSYFAPRVWAGPN